MSSSHAARREHQAAVFLASGLVLLGILALVMLLRGSEFGNQGHHYPILDALSRDAEVRVRLIRFDGTSLEVHAEQGLRLTRPDAEAPQDCGDSLRVDRREGTLFVDEIPCPQGAIVAPRKGSKLSLAGQSYPGRLSILPDRRRGHVFVMFVPLETYVACVLPREMPLGSSDSALRAQAIATRSYVAAKILARQDRLWDVVDTEASQVFGTLDRNVARGRRHVEDTRALVLAFEQEILPAYFSATCGGQTRSNAMAFGESAHPALQGSTCGFCDDDPDHSWSLEVRLTGDDRRRRPARAELVHDDPDRDGAVRLRFADGGEREMAIAELRRLAAPRRLKSTRLSAVELDRGTLRLEGRGFGHRVGLCQNGARAMGRAGRDERQILAHYYSGAEIVRLRP